MTMTMTTTTSALTPAALATTLREWPRTQIRLPLASVRMWGLTQPRPLLIPGRYRASATSAR